MANFEDIKQNSLISQRGDDLLKRRTDRIESRVRKESGTLKKIFDNIKEIDKVTGDLSKAFEDRLERITQLNASVEELKRMQNQMGTGLGSPGGGGPRGPSGGGPTGRFGSFMQGAGQMMAPMGQIGTAGGTMFNAYASYQQFANVNAEMMDRQNRISLGNISNQRFDDMRSAAAGNMAGIRRMLSDSFSDAMKDSLKIGQAQQDVLKTQMAGAISQGVGAGLSSAAGLIGPGKFAGAAKGMGKMGRAQQVAQGGANIASAGADVAGAMATGAIINEDMNRQLSQTRALTQQYQLNRQLQDAMSRIDDIAGQRAMDTFQSLTVATRGLGVGNVGAGTYNQIMRMQGVGVLGASDAAGSGDNRMSQPSGRANALQKIGTSSLRQMPLNDVEKEAMRKVRLGQSLAPDADFEMQQAIRQEHEERLSAFATDVFGTKPRPSAEIERDYNRTQSVFKSGEKSMSLSEYNRRMANPIKEGKAGAGAQKAANPLTGVAPGEHPASPLTGRGLGSYMDKWEGTQYVWGGSSLNGIDCSGFAQKTLMAGGALPSGADRFMDRTAAALREGMDRGEGERIDNVKDAREGDLIFFRNKYGAKRGNITHVGVSRGGGMMTDASTGKGGVSTRAVSDLEGRFDMEVYRPSNYGKYSGQQMSGFVGADKFFGRDPSKYTTRETKTYSTAEEMFNRDRQGVGQYGPGYTGETIQGGGDREEALSALLNPSFISQLAARGLGQDQLPKVVAAGVAGLGKEFARDPRGTLMRAAETAQVGYMQSPEQYMQARSALTGVGGGADDLERIMKNAVAAGMDSSKNIMEMVSATQSLSSRSAAMGIQSIVGSTEMIGRGVQALGYLPENMRSAAAANAAQAVESMSTDTSLSIANIMQEGKLRKAFGGRAKRSELEVMRRMSMTQVRELMGRFRQDPAAARAYAQQQFGLSGDTMRNMQDAQALAEAKRTQTETSIIGVGIDERTRQLQTRFRKGEPLSKDEMNELRLGRTRAGFIRGFSGAAAFAQTDVTQGALEGGLQRAPGGLVGGGEQAIAASPMMAAKEFTRGVQEITKSFGNLAGIGDALKRLVENVDIDQYAKTTEQSMSKIEVPMNQFGGNMSNLNVKLNGIVGELDTVLNRLKGMNNRGGTTGGSTLRMQNPPDIQGDSQ